MKPEFRKSKEKARQLVQDLELTLLRNITNKVGIYWDPTDDETIIEEDRELLEFYRLLEQDSPQNVEPSKWLLRMELNQEEMYNKNITMADVVFMIKKLTHRSTSIVYSDYNSNKLVVRIRIGGESKMPDYFTALKLFQNQLLNNCVIRGVPGIKGVTFRKDKQKSILQTTRKGHESSCCRCEPSVYYQHLRCH
jgi:DNA-directed RNA polymerase II subunit RPB1